MLIGRVARLYYEHGLTHQEIANSLGVSRIRVTRLLAEARQSGLVEIRVHVDDSLFADEERALCERFGLKQAWVSPTVPDRAKTDKAFAAVGAEALTSVLDKDSVVALGLSTAVALVADELPNTSIGATFVPLGGSSGGFANGSNPHELALRMADRTHGQAFYLPAPLLAGTTEAARVASADSSVVAALDMARAANILIAGVGSVDSQAGLLLASLPPEAQRELNEAGAVGDISARFFDRNGMPVTGSLDERIIGLDLDELKAIPTRMAFATGANKVEALRAALAGNLMNMLVTDVETARLLLAD